MKNLRRRLAFVASVAITAILVSGCGEEKQSNESFVEIEDRLGFSQEAILQRQSNIEGAIQACMKAQGFDYIPVDPFAQQQALTGKAKVTDEEFKKEFGYGISTLLGRGNEQSDPNDRIRKSLSSADRAAYDRALFGDRPGLTFAEAADSDATNELGGCTRQATDQEFGGTEVLTNLQKKFDELDERVLEDQRMVKAIEKWSACMEQKGYRYDEPEAIDTDLEERFEQIVPGAQPGDTVPPEGVSYDKAALAELQREEVRLQAADTECETKEITPVEVPVRQQYEAEFQEQNKQLISRVKPVSS